MRRRFLASDRTDLASERTLLACYRTEMARARTGLAFTRTGSTFIGLGIGLLRQLSSGPWIIFDLFLLLVGAMMALEGFSWYFPGRRAGKEGLKAVRRMTASECIWDFVCPASSKGPRTNVASSDLLRKPGLPGIWATTGLALERTVLAERRNVMARLRTIMARSRTGMAFIRTGISTFSVGLALQLYFGGTNLAWTLCNIVLMVFGIVIISDGLLWHVPGNRREKSCPTASEIWRSLSLTTEGRMRNGEKWYLHMMKSEEKNISCHTARLISALLRQDGICRLLPQGC